MFVDAGRKVDWAFDCAVQQSTCAMTASQCDAVCDLSGNCGMIFVMSTRSLRGRLIFFNGHC